MPNLDKNAIWNLVCCSNSDHAGDPDSCQSVSCYILYVKNVPMIWLSKSEKSTTLSSSEAEFVVLSVVAKDVMFVAQLFKSMQVKAHYPITVQVNKVENITTSSHTKHVDIRYNYVNKYVKDGVSILFLSKVRKTTAISWQKTEWRALLKTSE